MLYICTLVNSFFCVYTCTCKCIFLNCTLLKVKLTIFVTFLFNGFLSAVIFLLFLIFQANVLLTGHQYKMVIICGSEDTSNSKLVSLLEKYRRPPLPLMSDQVLLPYVKEKLKVTNQDNKVEESVYPAGNVDFERYIVFNFNII